MVFGISKFRLPFSLPAFHNTRHRKAVTILQTPNFRRFEIRLQRKFNINSGRSIASLVFLTRAITGKEALIFHHLPSTTNKQDLFDLCNLVIGSILIDLLREKTRDRMMLLLFLSLMVSTIQAFRMGQIHQMTSPRLAKEGNKLSMSLVQADWESPRVSVLTEIEDYPGSLHDILKYFWKHDINLTHIESRPSPKNSNGFHIYIDFHGYRGDPKTDSLMQDLQHKCKNMLVLDEREVPWFPRHISELDKIAIRVLDAGSELQCDHPGFHDVEYRERRTRLAQLADRHKYGEEVPYINYTSDEVKTWGIVYAKLKSLQEQYACPEYLKILPILEKECGYSTNNIPQVRDISKFLQSKTGFQIRPVSGLLSSRDFLSGLAFRVFFSTQYIRHSSKPLYTPEPDICHELIG